jgi:UDP-glucose 4-epimerase
VFNVGSTEEITIRGLAERVILRAGSKADIVTIPYAEAYEEGFEDMHRRIPDTAKIKAAIGWAATRSLDDILADVIAYETTRAVA